MAVIGTTFTAMIIVVFDSWFGGWLDRLIYRVKELKIILPTSPILLVVYN
jgi:ABC-type dipeptide/oligopeptide/nickel transport system permease subunit